MAMAHLTSRGTKYVIQVCKLPDHLVPHEGSWIFFSSADTRGEAIGLMNTLAKVGEYNWIRLATRETYQVK